MEEIRKQLLDELEWPETTVEVVMTLIAGIDGMIEEHKLQVADVLKDVIKQHFGKW